MKKNANISFIKEKGKINCFLPLLFRSRKSVRAAVFPPRRSLSKNLPIRSESHRTSISCRCVRKPFIPRINDRFSIQPVFPADGSEKKRVALGTHFPEGNSFLVFFRPKTISSDPFPTAFIRLQQKSNQRPTRTRSPYRRTY